jgi:TolA-binding protein
MTRFQGSKHAVRAGSLGISSGIIASLLFTSPVVGAAPSGEGTEPAESSDGNAVRYERKSGKVQTKNTLDTKFKTAQKTAEKNKGKKEQMMTADQFARQREAVSQEIADQQIEQLKRLIKATESSDPEMPDLLFRLSDHHLEKKAYFERQAGTLYDKIYAAEEAGKKAEANQLKEKQKRFEKQSKDASAQAVSVYKVLVTKPEFGKYKRLDEAIYFYAFELGQLNREAEMKDAYLRLIREYPTSKYIPNAYLSFADYYFGQNQIADALKLYQKIVDGYKDSPVYAYALYKMAWCYLNPIGTAEPQYTASLNKFVETIKATLEGRAGNEANAKQLRRDARRDLVKAYVHAGKPSKAWDFFTTVGNGPKKDEDMARKMMELLAVAYFGEGMYIESTASYKKLQDVYEADPDVCEWQARIVVNALATDDKQIQWIETEKLGTYWERYKDSKFKEPVKRKCRDEARDTIKQMATVWHDEAEKTRKNETYDLSEKAYRKFLEAFPQDKDAYELNYYYAEILWTQADHAYNSKDKASKAAGLKKFREAHDEFIKVLERKPDGKYTKEAAYAQMLAMKNALEYDETGGRAKACKTNEEGVCVYKDKEKKKKVTSKDAQTDVNQDYPVTEYTPTESEMLKSYDTYQKYVKDPKDKELPKIQYHRVKLMMEHNKFKEAKPVAIDLITKFDGTVYAAWASEMLVDILTINWTNKNNTPDDTVAASDELEDWSKKLQKSKSWKHDEADRIREAVPTLLAGIGWKRAEAYQEQGKQGDPQGYVRCGKEYVTIWNEFETHPKADILLFNAARCFEAAYLIGQSIKMRNELLTRYPSSSKYQQTLQELGANYQAIAYYGEAADRYEKYADKYPKDKFASDALQNAYLFRLGLGQQDKAAADLNKYEAIYKKKDVAVAAKIFWSKHALLATDAEKLAHANAYLSEYGGKGGADRQAVAHAEVGQILWRQSCSEDLLYDSCISIKRRKATAGEKVAKKAGKIRSKIKAKKKKDALPKFCGAETQALITVHKRDGKKASQAMSHLDSVLKLATKKPSIPATEIERAEAYKNAVGMAMVYTADRKYEEYLGVAIPDELSFGASAEEWKKDSGIPKLEKEYKEALAKETEPKKKFMDWYTKKKKLGGELVEQYAKVKGSGSPYWVLAAAARTARVNQDFADQLYRAPVPEVIKTEDQMFAYCDGLAEQADPLVATAKEALRYCLERSTEFQFFNEFSRMCEEELQQGDAETFPATNELFGKSVYTDSRLDVVGVQVDLEGDKKKDAKKPAAGAKPEGEKPEGEDADEDAEGAAGL